MEASNFFVSNQEVASRKVDGWRLAPILNGKENGEIARIALMSMISAVSGGFAIVQPGSQLSINAVEAFPLEDFSSDVSFLKDLTCFVLC